MSKEGFAPFGNEAQKAKEELFSIFKFAKHVLYGKVSYTPTYTYRDEFEDRTMVDAAHEPRALAVVDAAGTPPTVARDGLMAFEGSVRALLLNTNEASHLFLDESAVEALLLGADFCKLEKDYLCTCRPLRYLAVHGDNQHFWGEDNVLFNKEKTALYAYAALKPEAEYTVPTSVRVLKRCSFFLPRYLKKLYLPRGVRQEPHALCFAEEAPVEVVYY